MVNTASNSKENRVTVTNNAAKYYSEQSHSYANQAKSYADIAKTTESEIAALLENEEFDVIRENINNIKTVADNINNLGVSQTSWGDIMGEIDNQTDLRETLDLKADLSLLSPVAMSGSYNDLSDKPDIIVPDKVSAFTNDLGYLTSVPDEYVTESELTKALNDIVLSGSDVDLSNCVTKEELAQKGYLTDHQSLDGYATEQWVLNKNYLTEHQDISGKQDKLTTEQLSAISAVVNKANSSDVYTKSEIDTKLGDIESLLGEV